MFLSRPGNPGINYAHPLCKNLKFSFVASGGIIPYDLLYKMPGTLVTTAPTVGTDAILGNVTKFAGGGSYTFANRPAVAEPNFTFAALIKPSGTAGNHLYATNTANSGNGITINLSTLQIQVILQGIATISSGITLTTGVPYLIALSLHGGSAIKFMAMRLDTGAISTSSVAAATPPNADQSSYSLAGYTAFFSGDIAAVMHSRVSVPLDALIQLGRDPWGPWRPPGITPELMSFPAAVTAIFTPRSRRVRTLEVPQLIYH